MIRRLLVHVAGPSGSGKTTFIEQLLLAGKLSPVCAVRASREPGRQGVVESRDRKDDELNRYSSSGAFGAIRYLFGKPDVDDFYASRLMRGYSKAVLIEGDFPLDLGPDLSVYVAPPPSGRTKLLGEAPRSSSADSLADELERALESPEALAEMLVGRMGMTGLQKFLEDPAKFEKLRPALTNLIEEAKEERATQRFVRRERVWVIRGPYQGIERAQLVVVNVRSEAERDAARAILDDVTRLRRDDEVFRDVLWPHGKRTPVMAIAADLTDSRDAGTRKAIARVRRAYQRLSE